MKIQMWPWMAATLVAASVLLPAGRAAAEQDHLTCYKINGSIQPKAAIHLSDQFGSSDCTVGKESVLCVQSEKNAGDDPRGGVAGSFVCYSVSCKGDLPSVLAVQDQFSQRVIALGKPNLVCTPVETLPADTECGPAICGPGTFCCNPLLGICVKPGQICIQ